MIPFSSLPPHSRVWIYQNTREFTPSELELVKAKAADFVSRWTSHDQLMKASIAVLHNRFIVVCVDEKTAPASGCGIDKSVKFIQSLEKDLNISLLDRMHVAYRKDGKILSVPISEFKDPGHITVFNNLVNTKEELEKNWEIPLEQSWHKKFVQN